MNCSDDSRMQPVEEPLPVYVVTVEFVVHAKHGEAFRAAIIANARASRETEPGCRQFDVTIDPSTPTIVFLYEVYDDRAAFAAHLATAHFLAFDQATRPWVERKTARVFQRVDSA